MAGRVRRQARAKWGEAVPRIGGIVGGMSVDVTAALLRLIIDGSPAKGGEGHLPLFVYHNPSMPDCTAAIVEDGQDPLPAMTDSIDRLVRAGAEFIGIPSNTAHYFFEQLQTLSPVPLLHMVRDTIDTACNDCEGLKVVGLIASSGAVKTGLYHNGFVARGVKVRVPQAQDAVMEDIMRVKAREPMEPIRTRFRRYADDIIARGAQLIVLGCAEVSLALRPEDVSVPVVDALKVLSRQFVAAALAEPVQKANA